MCNQLLLLQSLAKWMERERINVSFCCPPAPDRAFWANVLQEQKNEDYQTLEQIAACLRKDTSDFDCIEEIEALVAQRGFDTAPRHNFG